MKVCLLSNLLLVLFVLVCPFHVPAQQPFVPQPVDPTDPKGRELPPGVPRTVDTNGNVIYMDISFTTRQYRQAAVKLILQEARSQQNALCRFIMCGGLLQRTMLKDTVVSLVWNFFPRPKNCFNCPLMTPNTFCVSRWGLRISLRCFRELRRFMFLQTIQLTPKFITLSVTNG